MTFVADEGIDAQIIAAMQRAGLEVLYVAELSPGITDPEVLELARADSSVLVTADKDFGELVFRQGIATHGVVLIPLAGVPAETKAATVCAVVQKHGHELAGSFTVVSDRAVRIRRLHRS